MYKKIISVILCIAVFLGLPYQYFAVSAEEGACIRREDGSIHKVNGVNRDRIPDTLTVYTCDFGDFTTPFDEDTIELIVVNDIVVEKSMNYEKGTYIPPNGFVISATGSAKGFVKGLECGEKAMLMNLALPFYAPMYFEVGGLKIAIDNINPSVRKAGEVELYNSSFPSDYTGTNPYGIEFTVIDGKVTKVSCLDESNWSGSLIAEDSTIISMHMDNEHFNSLRNVVQVGNEVKIVLDNVSMYGAAKGKYDAFNPKSREDNPKGWPVDNAEPYPGFRGEDQLIVYDDSYGETTGTNPYGYEVAVNNKGIVVEANANATKIPQGGYVLSGHGVQAAFLTANARIGSSVQLSKDDKGVVILYTPESYAEEARMVIEDTEESMRKAQDEYRDIDRNAVREKISGAKQKLAIMENQLKGREFKLAKKTREELYNEAFTGLFRTIESRNVETRAVWLRPKEENLGQVKKVLDDLKSIHVNTLYVELDYDGYVIFQTNNKYFETNPIFKDFDVLAAYIEEGKKRGIEVHAWCKTLCLGQRVADKIPAEWLMRNKDGEAAVILPWHKQYFINPGHPEGARFILDLYKEVVRNYDVKGIQVDYVRYPEKDYGYDEYTRNLFQQEKGVDPITLSEDSPLYEDWCQFRRELVNQFLYQFAAEMKSIKPEIEFSAAVWPNLPVALNTHFQDSRDWVVKDYLDNTSLMSYNPGLYYCIKDTETYKEFGDGHSIIALGMGANIELTSETLAQQVKLSRDAGAGGVAIFEYESLFLEGYDKALKEGAYKSDAVSPVLNINRSVPAVLNGIKSKIEEIYVPEKGITMQHAKLLKTSLNHTLACIPKEGIAAKNAGIVIKNMEGLKKIVTDIQMNENVRKRINSDINSAMNALFVIQARDRFMKTHEVERFKIDVPESFRTGQEFDVNVKAIFRDKSLKPINLDPSQFRIIEHDPNLQVEGGKIKICRDTKASVTVRILNTFKLGCRKGITKQLRFLINTKEEPSIEELMESYMKEGQLNSDLGGQLLYRVSIIHSMEDRKQFTEAVSYLNDLRSYISAPAVLQQGLITKDVLDTINAKVQEWIDVLQAR